MLGGSYQLWEFLGRFQPIGWTTESEGKTINRWCCINESAAAAEAVIRATCNGGLCHIAEIRELPLNRDDNTKNYQPIFEEVPCPNPA